MKDPQRRSAYLHVKYQYVFMLNATRLVSMLMPAHHPQATAMQMPAHTLQLETAVCQLESSSRPHAGA